jgi:hypothetical protein
METMKRMTTVLMMVGAILLAGKTTSAAGKSATSFKGDVIGSFFFHVCPADAPAQALCLHDDVAGQLTHLGRATGSFEVVFDIAKFGADGCGPIHKTGSFVAANGDRLAVEADGTFCFSTLVAIYEFHVAVGSGRFEGVSGQGAWLVPAPTTFDGVSGTGEESLIGVLIQ